MPQSYPWKQAGFNDMQLLQQHVMLKQLQELQRRQQLQQVGDLRQQSSLNQISAFAKQAGGGQFSPLINGTPVRDASQMFTDWGQRSASPDVQGMSQILASSQDPLHTMRTMSWAPQQHDASLYGTPIANTGGIMSQYPNLLGISEGHANILAADATNNQAQHVMNPLPGFSNSFLNDQNFQSSATTFISRPDYQGNNVFSQHHQGLSSGNLLENFQQVNALTEKAWTQKFSGREDQSGWAGPQAKTTNISPSQSSVTLDPLEEKILFEDDNTWDASLRGQGKMGVDLLANGQHTDHSSACPSIQCGTWSALMQSALTEASSSDTGLQEEWSGLTFQNTEFSADNQTSNFVESGLQQPGCVDNNLQTASSLSSKHFAMLNDSGSSFPGFQQSGIHCPSDQHKGLCQESSKYVQQSSRSGGDWSDSQQPQPFKDSRPVQPFAKSGHRWSGQIFENSESDARHQSTSSYHRQCNETNLRNQQVQSGINNSLINPKDFETKRFASVPSSMANLVSHKEDLDSHHYAYIKKDDSTMKQKDIQGMANDQYEFNSSPSGLASKLYEKRQRGNSSKTCNTIPSQCISPGRSVRENVRLNVYGSQHVPHSYCKSSGQFICQEGPQERCEQEYLEQSNLIQNVSNNATDLEKGHSPQYQLNSKRSEDLDSEGTFQQIESASFDNSFCSYGPTITGQESQNMLELLHNVNHPWGDSSMLHFGSSERLLQGFKSGTPDACVSQPFNHSSASQGFGLRLAPPSRMLPNPDLPFAFQSSLQMGVSPAESTSGLPSLQSQFPSQSMLNAPTAFQSSQAALHGTAGILPPFTLDQSQNSPGPVYLHTFGQQFPSLEAASVTQPSVVLGISKQDGVSPKPHNSWTDIPMQRLSSGVVTQEVLSTDSSNKRPETLPWVPCGADSAKQEFNYHEDQKVNEGTMQCIMSEVHNFPSQIGSLSEAQESMATHVRDTIVSGSSVTPFHQQKINLAWQGDDQTQTVPATDFEAFGRSLKSSQCSGVDGDEHNRRVKASVGNELNVSSQLNSSPSMDTKSISFLPDLRKDRTLETFCEPGIHIDPSHEMVTFGQNDSTVHGSNNILVSKETINPQISMQMANSWFKLYSNIKNGQMLPMYYARASKIPQEQYHLEKPVENLFSHAATDKANDIDANQVSGIWVSKAANLVASEIALTHQELPSADQSLSVTHPKKRKTTMSELLPWHKEVIHGPERFYSISLAEQDWARATHRLIHNVGNVPELFADAQPMFRAKKRLFMTTRLMQQVLHPAPKSVFCADATSDYDMVVNCVASLALGDACTMASGQRSNYCLLSENSNMVFERPAFEGNKQQYISKVVEEFTCRLKQLENGFLRSDKIASIVDIRVEHQELERFSVINRFAKFHSRMQADASGSSSSHGAIKLFPQRYVTVLPMPSNIPEGLQCLSL